MGGGGGKGGSGGAFGGSTLPTIAGVQSNVNSEINMTPMIDVMLVLLIIFMVITPALGGYTAVLPRAVSAEPESDDRVELGIDNNGYFYMDDRPQPINPTDLAARLQSSFASRPDDHVLYMKADQGVPYSVILTAIDAARVAGVRRIGAITEMPAPPAEGEE